MFKDSEKPPQWDIRSMYKGKTDKEIADEVATFFNRISNEFERVGQLTGGRPETDWCITHEQIVDMLKTSKKT